MTATDSRDVSLFDRFARAYDLAMPAADADRLAAGLAFADGPVERAIDVGGGTGRAAAALRDATGADGRGCDATVVDAAVGMLREARARGLSCAAGDAARLPVRDGAVDAVTVVDALHHFPDATAAVEEAARALRPGGVLVVREFDPSTVRGRLLAAAERLVGFDSTFHEPDDLAARFEDAGLATFHPDDGFGYTVVGVKRGD